MRSQIWAFFLLLMLMACAGAILVVEHRRSCESMVQAESFQRLVGGLGFGPALNLSSCTSNFDPRLEGGCSMDYGPIAGGACFNPQEGYSLFFYPPLKRGLDLPER